MTIGAHNVQYEYGSLDELRGIIKAIPDFDDDYILVKRASLLDMVDCLIAKGDKKK